MERSQEEQRTRLMDLKDFDLKKVKIAGKFVDVSHHENGNDAGDVEKKGQTVPHPDLKKSLDALAPFMARHLGLLEGVELAINLYQGVDLDKMAKLVELKKTIISRMNVGGLTFVGSSDKYGVIITGSVTTPESGSVGLVTPKISFEEDVLGYEKECFELCKKVIEEVHAYRFCNKKAQQDIFQQAEEFDKEEATQKPKKASKKDQQEEI